MPTGGLRTGIKRRKKGGDYRLGLASLCRSGAAQGGRTRWRKVAARLDSTEKGGGASEEGEGADMWGLHVSGRRERRRFNENA
jgi:hypothetical protein